MNPEGVAWEQEFVTRVEPPKWMMKWSMLGWRFTITFVYVVKSRGRKDPVVWQAESGLASAFGKIRAQTRLTTLFSVSRLDAVHTVVLFQGSDSVNPTE